MHVHTHCQSDAPRIDTIKLEQASLTHRTNLSDCDAFQQLHCAFRTWWSEQQGIYVRLVFLSFLGPDGLSPIGLNAAQWHQQRPRPHIEAWRERRSIGESREVEVSKFGMLWSDKRKAAGGKRKHGRNARGCLEPPQQIQPAQAEKRVEEVTHVAWPIRDATHVLVLTR